MKSPDLREPRRLGYAPQLNGLRAVAIAMVILFHLDATAFKGGWLGVDVFFVLSGFLITSLLATEGNHTGQIDLLRFYARRIFRLLPALLVLVAVVAIWASSTHQPEWGTVVSWTLEVRRNFIDAGSPTSRLNYGLGPTWTLAMEDQFYLVWPLVLLVGAQFLGRRGLAGVAIVGALASLVDKIALYSNHAPYQRLFFGPDCNADLLLIGCAAGLLFTDGAFDRFAESRFVRWAPWVTIIALAACLHEASQTKRLLYAGPTTVLAVLCAVMIVCLVLNPKTVLGRFLSWGPVVWIGKLSYSIYLWNLFVLLYVVNHSHHAVHDVEAVVVMFAFAIASYYLVERPGLKVKQHFEVRRQGRLIGAAED